MRTYSKTIQFYMYSKQFRKYLLYLRSDEYIICFIMGIIIYT